MSFRILRHSAASITLSGGVPLIAVSRQLGHATLNITAQVYAHLLVDSQLDDAAAFELPPEADTLRETLQRDRGRAEKPWKSGSCPFERATF